MTLLSIQNATYKYPQGTRNALENINLEVNAGEYVAILGSNGSGKSTLGRMASLFFKPDSGTVTLDDDVLPGIVFQQPKEQIVAGVVERDTAFGPQNLNLSKSEIELRTIECLSVIGLSDRSESRTFELSLGQTQRLAFSGILALFPDLLILDEVTAMLDPAARKELVEFIDQWNARGHTILHVTHDEDEALRAKRVVVLEKGKIIFDGSRNEFAANTEMRLKVFGSDKVLEECHKKTFEEMASLSETLKVENLSFGYKDRTIFENISFSLKKGTLTALTGPSGCGKSTLFECLAGLQETKSGTIKAVSRPSLALQESEASLFEKYAADDVAFGAINSGLEGKELVTRVKESMSLAGLDYKTFRDRPTFALSGGEKRKLSIAGIIALNKDIVIFDEPTSALDPDSRRNMLLTLRKLADSGKTVLFSTHRMEEADIADVRLKWEDLTAKKCQVSEASCNKGGADEIDDAAKIAVSGETAVSNETATNIEETEKSEENTLKKMDMIGNAKILKALRGISSAFTAPAQLPSSFIARMPAVVKLLVFLLIFSSSLVISSLPLCVVFLAVNFLYALIAKFPLKKPLTALKKLLPWILIFAVIEFVFFPATEGEAVLYSMGWFTVTPSKVQLLLKAVLRGFSAIFSIGTFIYTTSEREILDGLTDLLKPLALMKIPVRYFVLVVGIIFRFIPLLMDELAGILKTQIVRGTFAHAKGIKKIGIIIPLFVPMMLQTFRKAQTLSDALTARYFS